MPTLKDHIERAIRHYGSQAKLAEALHCSQQQVSYLLKASSISVEMAKRIDEVTAGTVSKHDLRADFFGPAPKQGEAA